MNDNEVEVRIVGNASGVAPAVAVTKGEVAGLSAIVDKAGADFKAAFGEQLRYNLENGANGAKKMKVETAELERVANQAASAFKEAFGAQMRENIQSGAEATERMTREMKRLETQTVSEGRELRRLHTDSREAAGGFGALGTSIKGGIVSLIAFLTIGQVKSWAEGMADAAEATTNLSQSLGVSVKNVQLLHAATDTMAIPFEKLQAGMGLLDKKFEKSPETFKSLGIDIKAGASAMDILLATMTRFQGLEDGPNKTALAMELMGRSGATLIPFLNQGAAGFAEFSKKAEEYGVVNERAVAAGNALDASLDENKLAFAGLSQTMTEAFGPMLTTMADGFNNLVAGMTESYVAGGLAKVMFDGIVVVVEGFGEVINACGSALSEMFGTTGAASLNWGSIIHDVVEALVMIVKGLLWTVVLLADGFTMSFHAIAGVALGWYADMREYLANVGLRIDVLKTLVATFATVATDALTLRWGSIAQDWDAGMAEIQSTIKRRGASIVAEASSIRSQAAAQLAAASGVKTDFRAWSAAFWAPKHETPKTGLPPVVTPRGGGGDPADLTKASKSPKTKAADTLVADLDAVLTAKKLAWSMAQDAQGTAQAYSIQSEAEYWKAILDRTNLSAKQRADIETKYLAAHAQVTRQTIGIAIAGFKEELAAADRNAEAKLVIANRELAFIGKTYGLESKEYADAQAAIVRIKLEAANQIRAIDNLIAQAADRSNIAAINAAEDLARHRVDMGAMTDLELLEAQRAFENSRFAINSAAMKRDLKAVSPDRDPVRYRQINGQIQAAELQHQNRLTQINQQAELRRSQVRRTAINGTASVWGQSIAKMITLQQSFSEGVRGIYSGMVNIVSGALSQMIEDWIAKQLSAMLLKRTVQSVDGVAAVTSNAAVAGAAAFASIAAIPVVGPELAPAAAAAAFAGAMSFAPLAAASGGWWDVPQDTTTRIHAEEMVLPAWAAKPLRSMLTGASVANSNAPAAANEGGGGGGGGGGYHYHDHTERGMTPSQIHANRGAFAKAMKMAHREGRFIGSTFNA